MQLSKDPMRNENMEKQDRTQLYTLFYTGNFSLMNLID